MRLAQLELPDFLFLLHDVTCRCLYCANSVIIIRTTEHVLCTTSISSSGVQFHANDLINRDKN